MPRPPHSPWFDVPNYIWGRVQIMKLLILQLPSFYCIHHYRAKESIEVRGSIKYFVTSGFFYDGGC
jgi:hypothetical protein